MSASEIKTGLIDLISDAVWEGGRLSSLVALGVGKGKVNVDLQWRRQDLLRGGAKLKIMSWGTYGGLQGRVQQLLDD